MHCIVPFDGSNSCEFVKSNCETEVIPSDSQNQTLAIPEGQKVLKTFFIRPLTDGDIQFTAVVVHREKFERFGSISRYVDRLKIIKVKHEGISHQKTLHKEFKLENSTASITFPFDDPKVNNQTIEFFGVISGEVTIGHLLNITTSDL